MCVFFFSSRRRHTRCSRDWSSDVCSSDLEVLEFDKLRELLRLRTTCAPGRRAVDVLEPETNRVRLESAFALIREARRSEEHTSELQSRLHLVCRLLLEKKHN